MLRKKGGLTRHENTAHCSRLHNYTEGENYAKIGKKKAFLSFSLFRRLVALINFPLLLLLSALSSPLAISHFQSRRRKRAAKGFTVWRKKRENFFFSPLFQATREMAIIAQSNIVKKTALLPRSTHPLFVSRLARFFISRFNTPFLSPLPIHPISHKREIEGKRFFLPASLWEIAFRKTFLGVGNGRSALIYLPRFLPVSLSHKEKKGWHR